MGYGRGDGIPLDFEPLRKLLPRSYPIQLGGKWSTSFSSARGEPYDSVE